MNRIYIEYTRNGKWNNAIFHSWDEFHDFTFDPCIDILKIKVD